MKMYVVILTKASCYNTCYLNNFVHFVYSFLGEGVSVTTSCCGTGAGHASHGGGSYNSDNSLSMPGGNYYGSLYYPSLRGSSGGASGAAAPGQGGGVISLTVGGRAFVDGNIMADASSGTMNAGGGSGGSVLIVADIFEGYGTVSANGGAGFGGGSGGRIAVHTKTANHFSGQLTAKGGEGKGPYLAHGGPGSVYIEETQYGFPYRKFFLDNDDHHWDQYYTLDETQKNEYFFHELHLNQNASLQMVAGRPQNLTVVKVIGDRTGRIHLHANHTARVEEDQPLTKMPINLWVDRSARVYLSTLVYIFGIGQIAFKWEGEVIGVRHLRIVPGRNIEFGSQAQTSFVEDGSYVPGTPGWFRFGSFELGFGANIALPPPQGLRLTVGFLVCIPFSCLQHTYK